MKNTIFAAINKECVTKRMNKMKKIILLSTTAIIFMLFAASCNKMCECTRSYENPAFETEHYDVNLEEAGLDKCENLNVVFEDPSGRTTIECVKKGF